MTVRLSPKAESQLAALPAPAARKVVEALRILGGVPSSGRRYPDDSEFHGLSYKTVVVRARRWSYRITYEVRARDVFIYFLYPASYPATHADLSIAGAGEE